MASSTTGPETKLEIRRMFAASREKVFEAWTQREKVEKWMCRFPQAETRFAAADARPGGTNLMEVTTPDGTSYKQEITFREIRPPEKLVFSWDWEKFSPSGQKLGEQHGTVVTVEFQPRGVFTEVFLTHEGFSNAEARENHNRGWNGCFDMLVEALKA
ncbi:MAG: SRPBCC domain-containing protein [Candidatus Acidiferrales bacterium]